MSPEDPTSASAQSQTPPPLTASDHVRNVACNISKVNLYVDPVPDDGEVSHGPGAAALPDEYRIADQNYGVIAMLHPGQKRMSRRFLMQFRGAFKTEAAAARFIDKVLYKADPDVEHFVISMWEWGWMPLQTHAIQRMNTKYHDPNIQSHMQGYFNSLEADRKALDARKRAAKAAAELNTKGKGDKKTRNERRASARAERAKTVWSPPSKNK